MNHPMGCRTKGLYDGTVVPVTRCYIIGFGKDGKGIITRQSLTVSLGTLAQSTGIIVGTKPAIEVGYRMLKSEVICTISGVTAGELNGLALYLVDGDYSLAEFEASMESNGPLGPNDSVNLELAMRFMKHMGAVVHSDVSTELIMVNSTGGPLLESNPRWTFQRIKSWNWIAYNHGFAPTTGATLFVKAKNFGVWVR